VSDNTGSSFTGIAFFEQSLQLSSVVLCVLQHAWLGGIVKDVCMIVPFC